MKNESSNFPQTGIKARALLITADPNIPISTQAKKVFIHDLPDPQVLKNAYFEMLVGATARAVTIKPDGTYCYGTREPEFAAVSVFISLMKQMELYLELGLRHPQRSMPVVVNYPFVRDNADFSPFRYQMRIGIGSGAKHGGLNKQIAFDLGVIHHEFGHAAVFLQTPDGDLAGKQGAALNEAIGDVLGALVMNYLLRIWYAKQIGQPFTANDLENDRRILGTYVLRYGIRVLKNSKRLPNDLRGEPHSDGLIIGGALADLLVEMVIIDGGNMENQIKLFTQMVLMSIALLPRKEVLFENMLQAMIKVDQQLCFGKYRSLIEHCFGKHGIVLDTTSKTDVLSILPASGRTCARPYTWMDMNIV